MRIKWLFLVALLMVASVARAAIETRLPAEGNAAVPRGHWSYDSFKELRRVQFAGDALIGFRFKQIDGDLTRYEFAVAIARVMGRLPFPKSLIEASYFSRLKFLQSLPPDVITSDDPNFSTPILADIFGSLLREFEPELELLGVRDPAILLRSRIAKPPRLKITPSFLHRTGNFIPMSQVENFVSPTFAEILARVVERDQTTGAIVSVKRKADAPQNVAANSPAAPLRFSLAEADDGQSAVIVLESNIKGDENVYETYRLRIDDAMRAELRLQKAH